MEGEAARGRKSILGRVISWEYRAAISWFYIGLIIISPLTLL